MGKHGEECNLLIRKVFLFEPLDLKVSSFTCRFANIPLQKFTHFFFMIKSALKPVFLGNGAQLTTSCANIIVFALCFYLKLGPLAN